ncbi:MAG: response regulator [Holophagales bacterium]|jgi:putative two-component system response regulator|nr:response regulator [Holophagales bacterium]
MQKTIFIVDDNDTNLLMAKEVLKNFYRVMTLPSAARMFSLLEKVRPDLILLDIEMPELDGFGALNYLKNSDSQFDIPVIFLTSVTDASIEARGFELGAVDFITKPFSTPVLLNRINTHLNIDEIIRERTAKLRHLQNAIIFGFADIVESRDHETGGHIERTTTYIKVLVDEMMVRGVYADELNKLDMELFISSARLHDIGKISIPDAILNKPGKLTDEEYEIMKKHSAEGERIIEQMILLAEDEEFFHNAKLVAGYHHERWDGKGYPRGLEGADIPIQGRIMAIVDVYDALISVRPYKKPFSHEDAVKIITEGSGKQFDPLIANVFYEAREQFKIAKI